MDHNMDGKIAKDEMGGRMRKRIGWKWIFIDRNFDGGLDQTEMERLFR